MHFKMEKQMSEIFFTVFIQFGHADFKYGGEIWPSRQSFAQIKL